MSIRNSFPKNYDTVIVGAGIAGLSAAIMLAERRPDEKIHILEADERPGGRVKSMQLSNGIKVDAGGHWHHQGSVENKFLQWAIKRYGHRLGPLTLDAADRHVVIWNQPKPRKTLMQGFNLLAKEHDVFVKENPGEDISLHDLALRRRRHAGAKAASNLLALEWMAVDNARLVSSAECFGDPLGQGGWQMQWLIEHLVGLMVEELHERGVTLACAKKVTDVRSWDSGVNVRIESGEQLTAKRCVVTVPSSLLKNRAISFGRRVETEIATRLEGTIMGNLAKIVVPVDEEFLERQGILRDTHILIVKHSIFVHARSAGQPVITMFRGGSKALEIENWSPGKIHRKAQKHLSRIPGLEMIGDHINGEIQVPCWGKNPLSQGVFTTLRAHAKRSDAILCDRIGFAGEALVSAEHSPGQMTGAFVSARNIVSAMTLN